MKEKYIDSLFLIRKSLEFIPYICTLLWSINFYQKILNVIFNYLLNLILLLTEFI